MLCNRTKVVIVCEAIPEYRIPVYQRLATIPYIDLEVVATLPHRNRPKGIKDVEYSGKFRETRVRMWALKFREKRLKIVPHLPLYILKNAPDVVIFADSIFQPMMVNIPVWAIYKLRGAKLIRWGCLGYEDPLDHITASATDRFILWLKQRLFIWNYADAEIAYSEFTAEYLRQNMNVPIENIFIAYNSIDTDELEGVLRICKSMPPLLPQNDHRVMYIGRLIKSKRVDILVRAFQIVNMKLPNSELIIIGDGPERQHLERMCQDLHLDTKAIFLGAIYDKMAKARYMLSSSLFALPGLGGLSINEAMSFGLPVVCSVADGTERQLVYNGITGYFAEYGNVDDYADKIYTILRNKDLGSNMGRNARDIIRNKVNIQSMISGLLDAINYVTKDRSVVKNCQDDS